MNHDKLDAMIAILEEAVSRETRLKVGAEMTKIVIDAMKKEKENMIQ